VDVGGVDQPPPNPPGSSAKTEARQATRAKPNTEAGQDRPGVLRVAAAVARAVTGAAGWLVDLWRQADQQIDHRPSRPPSTTTPTGEAMPRSPAAGSTSTRRLM
jgi:hypothetical protein